MALFALTGSEDREKSAPQPLYYTACIPAHPHLPLPLLGTNHTSRRLPQHRDESKEETQRGTLLPCLTFPWAVTQCPLGSARHRRCKEKEGQVLSGCRHGGSRSMRYPCREWDLLSLRAPSWPWKTTLQWAALLLTQNWFFYDPVGGPNNTFNFQLWGRKLHLSALLRSLSLPCLLRLWKNKTALCSAMWQNTKEIPLTRATRRQLHHHVCPRHMQPTWITLFLQLRQPLTPVRLTASKSICIHEKNNECIEHSGGECRQKRATDTAVNELNEISNSTFSQPNVHITVYVLRSRFSSPLNLETRYQYKIYQNLSECGQESQILYELPR